MGHESTTRFSTIICWEISPKRKEQKIKRREKGFWFGKIN